VSGTAVPVLHVVVSTEPGGGPQHVLAAAVGLRAHGWRPMVAGPAGGALVERFRGAGIETFPLASDGLSPLTLRRLVALVRRHGVRLLHSHGKGAGVHARLASRLTGVPVVHTLHGIHYERYPPPVRAAYLALERRLSRWTRVVINVSRAQEADWRRSKRPSASPSASCARDTLITTRVHRDRRRSSAR